MPVDVPILVAAVDSTVLLTAIVTAILSGGAASAFVALRKAPSEIESVAVGTLRDALSAQAGVLEELNRELARKDSQLATLHRQNGELSARLEALEALVKSGELRGKQGEQGIPGTPGRDA